MATPRVFISYSHDKADHKAWVLRLASDLRASGIDAILDQWDLVPGQDIAAFMQSGIATSDRVLLVCTEPYVRKADGGHGGVGYERLVVTAEVVASIETKKFIPIVRDNPGVTKTPIYLGPRLYIDFSDDGTYRASLESLCREVLGAPVATKPPLGPNPFSGEPPATTPAPRVVGPTGVESTGSRVLDAPWFAAQHSAAVDGSMKLGIKGSMELRFALHSPVAKSQIDLLNAVKSTQIETFGWPIGVVLDSRAEYRPRPFADGIRAEISIAKDAISGRESYDYWALATNGDFYLLQNLFEDMRVEDQLFFNTRIVRVTEALLFAEGIYDKLGVPHGTKLSVRVRHDGLSGRTLASAGGRRNVHPRRCLDQAAASESVVVNRPGF